MYQRNRVGQVVVPGPYITPQGVFVTETAAAPGTIFGLPSALVYVGLGVAGALLISSLASKK